MRLIDADEFKSVFIEKSTEAVCGVELCKAIISRIDDAPIIDAVPVDFIEKEAERMRASENPAMRMNSVILSALIRDWREQ